MSDVARIAPELRDVSETMLWSLYNRASEARRSDTLLNDPDSIHISEAMEYDFEGHFGSPAGSLAVRAAEIDRALRRWLESNPEGSIVSLGEGLETQIRRVDNGRMRWLTVDLAAAIAIRERFIKPTDRCRHLAVGALDFQWMDAVDPSSGVFIVAQGLLMYLEPAAVQALFRGIANRFPAAEMVFDAVPRWFSRMTMLGHNQTHQYRLPPMPWGIDRNEIGSTLRSWMPGLGRLGFLDYRVPRGMPLLVARLIDRSPIVRHEVPSLVHIALSAAYRPTGASISTAATAPASAHPDKENSMASHLMNTATLLLQSQHVVALRCAKIARGGTSARDEAYQMVCEKMKASFDATRMLMAGGTQGMVLAHYNELVSNNVKRLSGSDNDDPKSSSDANARLQ